MSWDESEQERYYEKKDVEHDRYTYDRPERDEDLRLAVERIRSTFTDRKVLEIACGTGFWTSHLSDVASNVFATDKSQNMLRITNERYGSRSNATIVEKDLYCLSDLAQEFDGIFGGFIWSHVPREKLPLFINQIASCSRPGAVVSFIDNTFIDGYNVPLCRTDSMGNTYQPRQLSDGSKFEIIKNFPSEDELRSAVRQIASEATLDLLRYFWIFSFKIASTG